MEEFKVLKREWDKRKYICFFTVNVTILARHRLVWSRKIMDRNSVQADKNLKSPAIKNIILQEEGCGIRKVKGIYYCFITHRRIDAY